MHLSLLLCDAFCFAALSECIAETKEEARGAENV